MLFFVYLLLIPISLVHAGNDKNFAVVELFASEGCSSCPPADLLLSAIVKDAKQTGVRIFPLSFQVDYWDYLGWKDPYSTSQNTKRQYAYAHQWGKNSAYTPQMIVNGSREFLGSDARKAQQVIDEALRTPAGIALDINVTHENENLKIDYQMDKIVANAVINIAFVEDNLVSQVTAGENRGETLRHDHVVRSFQSFALTGLKETVVINIPSNVVLKNCAIVAFIQDVKTYKILAAASKEF